TTTNMAHICGEVIDGPKLSHKTYGEAFYIFRMGVQRNSGYEDQINLMVSERILDPEEITVGSWMDIRGQIRTYNEAVEGRNRLNIVVFVRDFAYCDADTPWINDIFLEGYLCKPPLSRTSPLGRRICDMMLAVNRMYNKSDYIPCIAWGRNAVFSGGLEVGDKISIHGRLQSREYRKREEDGSISIKTAFEVSVTQLETVELCLAETERDMIK
ncbi:MAG: single-stranded DNA-binding protein, partial [Firmicutes bacterium]|nr:single-stranded DNA-binding protein [Bacillota bacterium]